MGDVDLVATDNASLDHAAQLIADAIRENEDLRDLQLTYMTDYELCGNGIEVATYGDGTYYRLCQRKYIQCAARLYRL